MLFKLRALGWILNPAFHDCATYDIYIYMGTAEIR